MTQSKLPVNPICVQSILSNITSNKINFEKLKPYKFSKNTISIRVNLVQVSPSVPSFLLAVFFIPSCNVVSVHLYVSHNLMAVATVEILINYS